jgi:DNA-binding protein HU-beta
MNKTEIIAAAAERSRIDKKTVADATNAVLDIIVESLVDGDPVRFTGLFTLTVKHQAERKGKNPKTNEEIDIDARRKVRMSVGKELKKAVNAK